MTILILILLFLPLGCSTLIGFGGRFLGRQGIFDLSCIFLSILNLSSFYLVTQVIQGSAVEIILCEWFRELPSLDYGFFLDSLSGIMCFLILFISTSVIFYSFEYMEGDAHLNRFISFLFLFIFFMVLFVTSNNLLQAFIGWEGVGLVSFLLVNFWFTRLEANRSALKAILFNKIGDIAFLAAVILLYFIFKNVNYVFLNSISFFDDMFMIKCSLLLIVIAAMGKSAQIGLHAWLPDAMEGPTPVSSLLHSATMVTLGIFLILRLSPLLSIFSEVLTFMLLLGGITSILGSTIAAFQNDLKKIIAYSTCSQLGLLLIAAGLMNFNGCFFHLVVHACFKALLFLTAGCIIHALLDEQDIRKMGGLLNYMPFTALCTMIGILGLVGFPFLSGYYSKEYLLYSCLAENMPLTNFIFLLMIITSIFTIVYSMKIFFYVFMTNYRGSKVVLSYIKDPEKLSLVALLVLSLSTIFIGYSSLDYFLGLAHHIWSDVLPIKRNYIEVYLNIEMYSFSVKNILLFFTIATFMFFVKFINKFNLIYLDLLKRKQKIFYYNKVKVHFFLSNWCLNYLYTNLVRKFHNFSFTVIYSEVNHGLIEVIFLRSIEKVIARVSNLNKLSFKLHFFDALYMASASVLFSLVWVCIYLELKIVPLTVFMYLCFKMTRKTNNITLWM